MPISGFGPLSVTLCGLSPSMCILFLLEGALQVVWSGQNGVALPKPSVSGFGIHRVVQGMSRTCLLVPNHQQEKDLQSAPTDKNSVSLPKCKKSAGACSMRPCAEPPATCRSISAKLISIRAMNLCQKPTGTKLILNTRWMVLAVGCRMP